MIKFKTTVTRHTMIHDITRLFHASRDSHPMEPRITGALAAFYHDSLDVNNPRHREIAAFRLLKMPTMAAMLASIPLVSHLFTRARSLLRGNFLNMMILRRANRMKLIDSGTCYGPYSDPALTMNRTPPPPPCVPLALRVRTRLPVSQQVLLHCGTARFGC